MSFSWKTEQSFLLRWGLTAAVIFMAAAASPALGQAPRRQTDAISMKLIQTLSKSELASLRPFNRDGVLAMRTGDTIQLWDTQSRALRTVLPKHQKILDAFFSPDGATFITSSREKTAALVTRLWDAQTGKLKVTLNGLVIFGPTSTNLVVTLTDKDELKFWNAETGALQKTVTAYQRSFSNSAISSNGKLVVKWGSKKALLWEAETGGLIAELIPPKERDFLIPYYHEFKVEGASFSPNSKIVATKDSLDSIQLWDTDTGRFRALLQGHSSSIYSMTFSPDGQLLASASRDGTARLWDVETGRLIATLRAGKEIARRIAFDSTGSLLVVGYQTQARLWDVSGGQLRATLEKHKDISTTVVFGTYLDAIEILLSPDGKLLLTIGNKRVKVWNTATGELITTLEGARSPVVFAPGGRTLAATGPNESVQLWTIE